MENGEFTITTEDQIARVLPFEMIEKETEILAHWREYQAPFVSDGQFVRDGIVHYPTYKKTIPRMLFLLKEPNDKQEKSSSGEPQRRISWNLAVWLGLGAPYPEDNSSTGYKTWEVIARWVHDITATNQSLLSWEDLEKQLGQHSINERAAEFRKIAIVNIKKSGGGGTTDISSLYPEIKKTHPQIISQIKLYAPTIVICGGTFEVYRERIAHESDPITHRPRYTKRGVRWYLSQEIGVPVVDYPHYAYYPHLSRAIKPAMHYGLVDAVHEIMGNREEPQ